MRVLYTLHHQCAMSTCRLHTQFALLHPRSAVEQLQAKARALVAASTEKLVGVGLDERAVRCCVCNATTNTLSTNSTGMFGAYRQ